MVGGALEYVALITGFQAVLLLIGALYVMAYLLGRRFRFLADAGLVDEREQVVVATSGGPAFER